MLFWERLAEQRIEEAIVRGEFDDLPGAGKPLPVEEDIPGVAPALRLAYRILKNAGFVPEEVRLRRELGDVRQLLHQCRDDPELVTEARRRLYVLTERLGQLRGGSLMLEARYFQKLAERLDGREKKARPGAGHKASSASKEV